MPAVTPAVTQKEDNCKPLCAKRWPLLWGRYQGQAEAGIPFDLGQALSSILSLEGKTCLALHEHSHAPGHPSQEFLHCPATCLEHELCIRWLHTFTEERAFPSRIESA